LEKRASVKLLETALYLPILYTSKSDTDGAQTTIYLALEDSGKLKDGAYYQNCKEQKCNPEALDETQQKKLWEISEQLIKEKLGENAFKLE